MSRSLRFCMITTFYPPYNFGGDGVFVHGLSNELAARGHRVDVIHCVDSYRLSAPPPSQNYRDHPEVSVHGLKSRLGFLSPLATHQIGYPLLKSARIRSILTKGFDVIHYHNISLLGGPAILKWGRAIKLCTMHDYWFVCPTHALFRFNREPCTTADSCFSCTLAYRRPPQLWRYSSLLKGAISNVDAFIAPSLTSQRKHELMGLRGRIEHIPNFVSLPHLPESNTDPSDRSGKESYFLFVGRLEKLKGIHTVIPAFQEYKKAQLWIVGTGSEESELRQLARSAGNIRFLGYQSGMQLQKLYRNAVALIYPAINFQSGSAPTTGGNGAPLVVMEAFSNQTPVVVNNLGRVPALVTQTGGGLVYSTQQQLFAAMNRLLASPSYRRELGLCGYEAYQRSWTPAAYLQRYFDLIEDIEGSGVH